MPAAPVTETEGETKEMAEGKSPAVVDRPSGSEKTKDELWEECVSLQEELQSVRKEKKHLRTEIALMSSRNSKTTLEKTKARLREKLKLKQEAEKRNQAEIKEHQQKLAQLESAQHSEICELKMAAMSMTSKTHEEQVESEVDLQKKTHLLQVERGEKEALTEICIRKLKQKQQDELRELHESHEKKVREMEVEYMKKTNIMFEEHKEKTKVELAKIDEEMEKKKAIIIKEQDDSWLLVKKRTRELKCADWNKSRMEARLKELETVNKQHSRVIEAAVQKNKHLKESLQEMEQKSSECDRELAAERKAMVKRLKKSDKMTARIVQEKRELYLKHHQLEMKYEQAQQEYEELQKKHTEAILKAQHRRDLKVLVLERQIKSVTETLEKEQLKLSVALAVGLGDQTAATNIKTLFKSKHSTIEALKDDISARSMEYDRLLKKATALDPSADKWFSTWKREVEKNLRKASGDSQKFEELMEELNALCISEDNSVQKEALGPNPAGAESRQ
ncbi:dynein regulatory complex subunit 4-like [Trachinotus anak]